MPFSMTTTTLSGASARFRRHAARQFDRPAAAPATPESGASPRVELVGATHARAAERRGFVAPAVAGIVIALLHAGVFWLALHRSHDRVEAPKPLPMTVQLTTSAPVPLQQAAPAKAVETPPPPKLQAPQPVHRTVTPPKPTPTPPVKSAEPAPSTTPAPTHAEDSAPPTAAATSNQTAAPAPAARSSKSVHDTPPSGDAAYLHNPAPDYPAAAQDQGWEGRVLLRVHVLASGQPDSVTVATSSGKRVLDEAALAAVRRWAFVPAKRGDEAVDGYVTVPLDFKLN
jgi:protein TonB